MDSAMPYNATGYHMHIILDQEPRNANRKTENKGIITFV